jgi:hypothetical protein
MEDAVRRSLHVVAVLAAAAGVAGCARTQARTVPQVAMLVPPPPPRVAIPVSLPEPAVEPEEAPPEPAPPAPPPTRTETPAPRTVIDRPSPPPAAATDAPAPVLQTTPNVGALEQRVTWLIGDAEKNLERVNRGQLGVQARAQFDRAVSYIRGARNAMQIRNFNYAEQLADKAARIARALVPG